MKLQRYLWMSFEAFLVSSVIGALAYLAFPSLPDIVLKTVKVKVDTLAKILPLPVERITVSILIWNTLTVLLCVFGGPLALLLDKLSLRLAPPGLRETLENPPHADLLVKIARRMGYDVNGYKEADVILTLKLAPLIVPVINGIAAGSFAMWLLTKFGPETVLGAALLPHGLIEFPTLFIAAALGMYSADYLIRRVRVHEKWPKTSLRVPKTVVRGLTACTVLLAEAAFVEVHLTPVVAGSVLKCA